MTSKKSSDRDPIAVQRNPRKQHPDLFRPQPHAEMVRRKLAHYERACAALLKRIKAGEPAEQLAKSREILGQEAWSLMHLYDQSLDQVAMKELVIVPNKGNEIGRGQSGRYFAPKDKVLSDYKKGCEELQRRIKAGEDPKILAEIRKKLGNQAWDLEHLYNTTLNQEQMTRLGIVPIWGK